MHAILVEDGDGAGALTEAYLELLAAELATDGYSICASQMTGQAASIRIQVQRAGNVRQATLAIEDSLTNKALVRVVDLIAVPEDSVALTLAIATEELLRASWLELGPFKEKRPSKLPADEPPGRASPPRYRALIGVVVDTSSAQVVRYGPELSLQYRFVGDLWVAASVGLRAAETIVAASGLVDHRSVPLRAQLQWSLWPSAGRAGLDVGLWAGVDWAWLRGEPEGQGRGYSRSTWIPAVGGSLQPWLRWTGPLRLAGILRVGSPLRELIALDEQQRVAVLGFFSVEAGLGVGAAW